jgi:hypothetical protein
MKRFSMLSVVGMVTLVMGLSGSVLAAPPANNPGQPFDEILAAIGILNDKIDDLEGKVDDLQDDVDNLPAGLGPCEVPPVWGKTYALADRFVSVLGGNAFCDQATGLVWDRLPVPAPQGSWQAAVDHCPIKVVGGLNGFHLPTIEQLGSLAPLMATDLNSDTGDGPFTGVLPVFYWSASTSASNPAKAWGVSFGDGLVSDIESGINGGFAWCVRGGQAYDGQQALDPA